MHQTFKRLLSISTLALGALVPSIAHADAPVALTLDVSKMIESSYAWLQGGTGKGNRALKEVDKPVALSRDKSDEPQKLTPPIRMSLVARDWDGAFNVSGGTMVSDVVRLSRSSRMAVGRARLDFGKFNPYAHVALGEWRYDPAILTMLPRNQEYATQFAVGFEYKLAKYARLGMEADYTILCRESREPQNNPNPSVLGTYAVVRTLF